MGKKTKWFEDKQQAASALWADVGQDNIKVYDISSYQQLATLEIHCQELLDKCSHVEVAVSGDETSRRNWMLIAPYRVDENKLSDKFFDIDPVLLVLDTDTGVPHQSGVVAYHRKFPNRTTPIEAFAEMTTFQTVQALRQGITTGSQPLEIGSEPVLEALRFMHSNFAPSFLGLGKQ